MRSPLVRFATSISSITHLPMRLRKVRAAWEIGESGSLKETRRCEKHCFRRGTIAAAGMIQRRQGEAIGRSRLHVQQRRLTGGWEKRRARCITHTVGAYTYSCVRECIGMYCPWRLGARRRENGGFTALVFVSCSRTARSSLAPLSLLSRSSLAPLSLLSSPCHSRSLAHARCTVYRVASLPYLGGLSARAHSANGTSASLFLPRPP